MNQNAIILITGYSLQTTQEIINNQISELPGVINCNTQVTNDNVRIASATVLREQLSPLLERINEMRASDTNLKLRAVKYENPNQNTNIVTQQHNINEQDLRTIFIGFIPTNTSDADLISTFSAYGAVEYVKIHNSRKSANVMYKDQESTKKAIQLNHGKIFKGQRITVSYTTKVKEQLEKNNMNTLVETQPLVENEVSRVLLPELNVPLVEPQNECLIENYKQIAEMEMNKQRDQYKLQQYVQDAELGLMMKYSNDIIW